METLTITINDSSIVAEFQDQSLTMVHQSKWVSQNNLIKVLNFNNLQWAEIKETEDHISLNYKKDYGRGVASKGKRVKNQWWQQWC